MNHHPETVIRGVAICRGIAVGKPLFFSATDDAVSEYTTFSIDAETEIRKYHSAVEKSRIEIEELKQRLEKEGVVTVVAILEAQLQMLLDPLLSGRVETEIRNAFKTAESALQTVINNYEERFNKLTDSFFRSRFKDILDIARRIMGHLKKSGRISLANIPENSIIFSKEISTSDTAEANMSCVAAFVTERGGIDSHAAIVAKARGTPFVSNIGYNENEIKTHSLAIVDGRTGDIILSPTAETLIKYQQLNALLSSHLKKLDHVRTYKSETFDGYSVKLSANIEIEDELDSLHEQGGHGVGLFRSEYIFLQKDRFPSEEEQFEIYRSMVMKMNGLPIVIRTFDLGGDKPLPNNQPSHELNPSLGCRAIRFLLKEKNLFKSQLRAILRSSAYGDVSILFPMVSTLSELLEAKQLVRETQNELKKEGLPLDEVQIGCMIEAPSAAIIADILAKECDFLSIGTNDLVQYALAVDRSNHEMNGYYTPTHPSVLRLIKLIVQEANYHGIPVSVCGEIAADPRFTPLLLGLGVHELSVATRYLPIVKHAIRSTSIVDANLLAEKSLMLNTSEEIQNLLAEEYKKNVPDDCFYNY